MRVYYDNVIASGLITGDLKPEAEMAALHEIERAHEVGRLKRVTSTESWREQKRTQDAARRSQLEAAQDLVSVVQVTPCVRGLENDLWPNGKDGENPIPNDYADELLFDDLRRLGLQEPDARHFMFAAKNNCDRFVTLDGDFLDRRSSLECRCPSIRVVRPSELAAELKRTPEDGAC